MLEGTFTFPGTEMVHYGPRSLTRLGDVVEALGARRAFAIASRHVPDLEERLREVLGDRFAGVFTDTPMHVPRTAVLAAADAAREAGADLIVSVGGGTHIDCAAGVTLVLATGIARAGDFDAHRVRFRYPSDLHVPPLHGDVLPHVSVPTTLSGAEATTIFGVTDPDRQVKDAYVEPRFAARAVIYDPELTLEVPAWLWATTGMRAVDHAVEGLLSKRHMPMADALGAEGLRILRADLVASAQDPSDLDARMRCQLAGWLCIYALQNVGTGLSHGLGHQLAAQFGMLHGVTSACMLPHVVAFNADVTGRQLERVGAAFGTAGGAAAVAALRGFVASLAPLGVPSTLQKAGARRDELADVAEHTLGDLSVAVNPKPVTHDDLVGLLEAAWS